MERALGHSPGLLLAGIQGRFKGEIVVPMVCSYYHEFGTVSEYSVCRQGKDTYYAVPPPILRNRTLDGRSRTHPVNGHADRAETGRMQGESFMEYESHLRKNPRGSSPLADDEAKDTGMISRRPAKKEIKDRTAVSGSPASSQHAPGDYKKVPA